ncbi:MAG TPA: hypothetical protein VNM40_01605 [Candidatus Paceibacterota bacterium]|jgi:nucleoid DNA-binding protein|nr:hypothetical protein [Candidatus Paceibacterota bacterium]
MAWTPPIDRRAKKELLKNRRFYRLLSEQCPFMDQDTAFVFYTGLVAVVAQELRRHGVARMPHLGDFALVEQKARPAWVGNHQVMMGAREVLKFYPKERMRRYFNKRQKAH